jgi:hypothetical protein
MGDTSDRFGFAHEVPNLGILGASVMGTSGAPAESRRTIMLNPS